MILETFMIKSWNFLVMMVNGFAFAPSVLVLFCCPPPLVPALVQQGMVVFLHKEVFQLFLKEHYVWGNLPQGNMILMMVEMLTE